MESFYGAYFTSISRALWNPLLLKLTWLRSHCLVTLLLILSVTKKARTIQHDVSSGTIAHRPFLFKVTPLSLLWHRDFFLWLAPSLQFLHLSWYGGQPSLRSVYFLVLEPSTQGCYCTLLWVWICVSWWIWNCSFLVTVPILYTVEDRNILEELLKPELHRPRVRVVRRGRGCNASFLDRCSCRQEVRRRLAQRCVAERKLDVIITD